MPRTYLILLMILFAAGYGFFLSQAFKTYGNENLVDEEVFITTIGSLGGFFNGVSRSFWASLQDKVGFRWIFLIVTVI